MILKIHSIQGRKPGSRDVKMNNENGYIRQLAE